MADIHLPPLGETVEEARISAWLKEVGDTVEADEPLFVAETDKVETEIPAPSGGVLTARHVEEGDTVLVGALVATLGGGADALVSSTPSTADSVGAPQRTPDASPVPERVPNSAPSIPSTSLASAPSRSVADVGASSSRRAHSDPRVRSPLVRRLLAEHDLDPGPLTGSGNNGRITRADVLAAVAPTAVAGAPAVAPANPHAAPTPAPAPRPAPAPVVSTTESMPDDPRWERFTRVRKVTGQRMLLSATTIPQVTTVMRLDYENVHQVRQRHAKDYKARAGHSLTYLPFVALAVVNAIREFPHVNATVRGDGLLVHPEVHLGIAVDMDFKGLVVPVVKNAQELRLEALAARISGLAGNARAKRLGADDMSGSTFTITNPGSYGTLAGTPLVNPPEVAILCVEGISLEPVVVHSADGTPSLAFHHVGHLSLTWDHRAMDGAYAAAFLAKIRSDIETRDWGALLQP